MAVDKKTGANRHYIPQALLRGFGTPNKKKKSSVEITAYFKTGKIVKTSTRQIGSGRNFYSDLIDSNITEYEKKTLSTTLNEFRRLKVGEEASPEKASELVVHLSSRHAQTREMSKVFIRSFVDAYMAEALINEKMLFSIVRIHSRKHGFGKFALDKFYAKYKNIFFDWKLPKIVSDFILLFLFGIFLKKHIREFLPELREKLERDILSQAEEGARRSHAQILEKSLVPEERLKKLGGFKWKIENAPTNGAILPDCIVLCSLNGKYYSSMYGVDHKEVAIIYMPIAVDKILVGCRKRKKPKIPEDINVMAVECSSLFFVAKDLRPEFRELLSKIGTKTSQGIELEVRAAVKLHRREIQEGTKKKGRAFLEKFLESEVRFDG